MDSTTLLAMAQRAAQPKMAAGSPTGRLTLSNGLHDYLFIYGLWGGVLSPFLFAVFIDSVVEKIKLTGVGCYYFSACVSIFLYADDILLIAPSVSALQILLSACDEELTRLGMQINEKKVIMHAVWFTL